MKTFLFDLDGTLLPMNERDFEKVYFKTLYESCSDLISQQDLVQMVWSATKQMVMNIEYRTNEEVFYSIFRKLVGEDRFQALEPRLTQYYEEGFGATRAATSTSSALIAAVNLLKEKGYACHIATNPMFPRLAIDQRIEWTGIDPSQFSSVTYFEESHYCKPQIQYYQEILDKHQLDPKQTMMVGNNELEDMIARNLGLETFLVEDCILPSDQAIEPSYRGSASDFLNYVKQLTPCA